LPFTDHSGPLESKIKATNPSEERAEGKRHDKSFQHEAAIVRVLDSEFSRAARLNLVVSMTRLIER
jgi:hypothetical protein